MIDQQKFFDHPIRNNVITYDNIQKRDGCTNGCLLEQ